MKDETAFGPKFKGLDDADGKSGIGRGTRQIRQDIGNIAFCRHGQTQERSGGDGQEVLPWRYLPY